MSTAARLLVALLAAALAAPAPAHAHLMNTGLGPFYDGMLHLLLTPESALAVIAVILCAGLDGPDRGRRVLLLLPMAWVAGTLAAMFVPVAGPLQTMLVIITLAAGVSIASDRSPPAGVVSAVAVAVGGLGGVLSGRELATSGLGLLAGLGSTLTVLLLACLLGGQVAAVRATAGRMVVRVAGSWIAAIAMLILGWSMRAHAMP